MLLCLASRSAFAGVGADFGKSTGGSVRVGDDSAACSAAKDGAIRYKSTNTDKWEYCLGSTWTPFRTGDGSIFYCQPTNCYIDTTTPASSSSTTGCISPLSFRWGTVTDQGDHWEFEDPEVQISGVWHAITPTNSAPAAFCHELGRPLMRGDYDWSSSFDTTRASASVDNSAGDLPEWYNENWANNYAASYISCKKASTGTYCPEPKNSCSKKGYFNAYVSTTVVVPAGCSVEFKAWGAGGGAGGGEENCGGGGGHGGSGGFASIRIGPQGSPITYYVVAGGGGLGGERGIYGGGLGGTGGAVPAGLASFRGGAGGTGGIVSGGLGGGGGSGGSASGVWVGSAGGTPVIIAGGGGGGPGSANCADATHQGRGGGVGPTGGTSSGGTGTTAGAHVGGGGGGGAGGLGGAGGAASKGGNGGSGYSASGTTINGSGTSPGGWGDIDFPWNSAGGGEGNGGIDGENGQDGVIFYRMY